MKITIDSKDNGKSKQLSLERVDKATTRTIDEFVRTDKLLVLKVGKENITVDPIELKQGLGLLFG